ncbi:MAG TPA: GNAT family N-acetyltransferase [Dehalococcoidia bacterium]|nr:GNAT family N-acetyltransferase [Dehalococcoidia bacterium]
MTREAPGPTGRLTFRELRSDDLPACLAWRNDPDVAETLSTLAVSATELELWFAQNQRSPAANFFAIELGGELIGYVGLRDIDWESRVGTLDITIGRKDLWNQGFGTEATSAIVRWGFEALGLDRIELTVLPFNERGVRCYEKVGFKRTGVTNQRFLRRGRLWHPLRMTLTQARYELAQKALWDGNRDQDLG